MRKVLVLLVYLAALILAGYVTVYQSAEMGFVIYIGTVFALLFHSSLVREQNFSYLLMGLNPNLTTLSQYGGCYGIDTELFKPFSCEKKAELRSKYHLPEDAFIITYAGRFVPVKRIDLLIRSFNTLKNRLKNAYLLLVGDGPEKPNLQRLARENPNIQFLNFLNQKLLSELYGASDMIPPLTSLKPDVRKIISFSESGG